ncbi:MAG TPA: hypothetical protein VJQ45_06405 [Ktedonobacterales bacterium]|nr:hypothetical protein [Ktedonobacterales bacterium]
MTNSRSRGSDGDGGTSAAERAAREIEANEDYINTPDEERDLGLPYDESAEQIAAAGELRVTRPEVVAVERELSRLDWKGGLHRDDIKARWPGLPVGIYLRLPASKKYYSPEQVLVECGLSSDRAEGMFMGANPEAEFPEAESVNDGGPPGWGNQPAVYPLGAEVEGGSAEDTEGLLPGQTVEGGEPESSS